jgi:aspartate/methionine/tyrosine aminotransferase
MSSQKLQEKILEEAGVAVIAGTSFGVHGEGFLRFSYANSIENIREALKKIARCIA